MGKWDRRNYARPRRRYYRDYQWSPPPDEPCPDPETEVWHDNVPMWEKKFCYLVGRMPWKKVLSTRNFMHCHSNVLTWDDSAGEEAFSNAKRRFWEEFSGQPCETQLPNPDMYIDEINWNPYIDPELAKELDRVYYNPDDKYYLPSACTSKENNEWSEDTNDPWDHGNMKCSAIQDKSAGWKSCDDSVDKTSKLTTNNDPWESHHTQEPEIKDNSWGGAWNSTWGSKRDDQTNLSKSWRPEGNNWNGENKGWKDRGACSKNWNQDQRELFKPNYQNRNYRAQQYGNNQESRLLGNSWGKQHKDYNCDMRGSGNVYRGRGRGRYTSGCRKREGSDYHALEGPRVHEDGGCQPPRYWNTDNNKRVSFGGQWS
ncbi:uncharacterized protein LOC141611793 [Silene latifolia]|uniref:uncharacterized protein LOC141611793 n=1 Tax=Silene latifolia TaxID=37657 RepID=UPI003D7892CD